MVRFKAVLHAELIKPTNGLGEGCEGIKKSIRTPGNGVNDDAI